MRHARLQAQVPLLHMTMIAVVIAAMLAASANTPLICRGGIPILVTIIGRGRLFWWLEHQPDIPDATKAARPKAAVRGKSGRAKPMGDGIAPVAAKIAAR